MKMFFRKGAVIGAAAYVATLAGLSGQNPPAPKGEGPRLQFSETTFDFGRVQTTDKLTHVFIVTNTGNATLEITAVTSSCGCTTVGDWDRQVPPGQTGKIPVNLNPIALWGSTTKHVTLSCNDPVHNGDSLQIQASVWREVDVEPLSTHFIQVEGETTNETRIVHIRNNVEEPLTLEPPQSTNPNFRTELTTVKAGKEYELKITFVGQITDRPQGTITIPTSSRKVNTLNISAYAMLQRALEISPSQIQLTEGPGGALAEGLVLVRNNSPTPVSITDAAVNAEGVTVQIVEANPGKFFNLRVAFPPKFQLRAGQSAELTFKTSHPKFALVRVPIVPAPSAASAARSK